MGTASLVGLVSIYKLSMLLFPRNYTHYSDSIMNSFDRERTSTNNTGKREYLISCVCEFLKLAVVLVCDLPIYWPISSRQKRS